MEQVMVKTKTKKKKREKHDNVQNTQSGETSGVLDSCEDLAEACSTSKNEEPTKTEVEVAEEASKIEDTPNTFDRLLVLNKNLISELKFEQEIQEIPKIECIERSKTAACEAIKPYTEAQLAALYTNSELEMLDQFTSQYVEAELKGFVVKQHPLYELLSNYVQIRGKITGNSLELEQLRNEYSELQSVLWTTDTATVTGRGECQDGSYVTASHSYQKATFHRSVFQSIVRVLGHIRKITYENHVLYSYTAEDLRLQIELYIQTAIAHCINASRLDKDAAVALSLQNEPLHLKPYLCEIRLCISVLFAFQRKLIRDSQFVKESRQWLSRLVAVLLRLATYQDHLFILNHILRCPAGVGSWAASFIQTPIDEILQDSPFSSYQINHVLSVLSMILTPIKDRERFLEDISQTPGDSLWIVVDSDGEEDEESGNSLRENDLVALLAQLPLESLFRCILLIDRKNFENCYDPSKISEHHILRFLAFSTVFLKIIQKGLNTYDQARYNQFLKRLSRLIRHLVQYATDQWEQFKQTSKTDDQAMLKRLQVEYDAFFLRAIYYLYTSQKLGAWQFLAVVPYNLITTKTAWQIFYFLHDSDASTSEILNPHYSNDYKSKIWIDSFRLQFEEKIQSLADDELYYLLNTFANMALARDSNDVEFIEVATRDLLQIGFISSNTQELCSKSARTLLTHITSKYPNLLSIILKNVKDNMDKVGNLALYLYEELPLTIWQFSDDDLSIITSLLSNNINTPESKLARMILSRLNWDILPYDIHCDVALLVLRATEQEPGYIPWAWQTILRLKLHYSDKLFHDMQRVLDPIHYEAVMKGVNHQQPLASFVAVLMTSWGHLVPLICSHGLSQLILLQSHQKHEAVLFALYLIVPLFVNSQEYIINNEKFQEIILNLINADRGYISMAKSLISVQNTVLQQFGNMIETQIVNYANYDLDSPRCLVRMWINTLVSIPNWNRDFGVLYLMDVIIRAAFFHHDALDAANTILKELLQCNLNQENSAFSSIFKWVSNSNSSSNLICGSLSNYTWLAYLVIELEHEDKEKRSGLWRELLILLHNQKGKVSVDAAIKKATSVLKMPAFTSSSLCIYRWAQQAMDSPVDHPLVPLIWQKFFSLYLARMPLSNSTEIACVGDKFFDGLVNFAFLKKIKRKLQEALDFYKEQLQEAAEDKKLFLQNCVNVFAAFSLWLEEPRLQKSNLLLQSLPSDYQPNLLAFIFQGSNTAWYEYVDYNRIKREQAECVKIWQISNFRLKNNVNRPLLNPGKSMESSDPVERILRRLSVYETPKPPPSIKNNAPVVPVIDFSNKDTLFSSLDQCFKTLKQFAHNQTLKVSEHKALDCSYQELVPQLYRSVLNKVTKKVPCRGRNDTVNCSGAGLIVLEMQEARVNDRIDHQIQTNRSAYESLLAKSLQAPATGLCTASVTIQQAVKVLQAQVRCNPATSELGSDLFYYVLSLINEETSSYLPTKTLFASCLEKLGQSHICGVEFEMPRLLEKILKEPDLGIYLAPHFSPGNVGTANLLFMYSTICNEIGTNFDVAFALLSKFEIDKWLKLKDPKLNQRSEFIQCVIKALSSLGYEPPIEAFMLHGLYRKHLLTVFEFQFPEHYGEILIHLLKASNGNTETSLTLLSKSVWIDIVNSLSKPLQINPKAPLRDQLRQYAQQQRMLQHQELLETAELFYNHFTQERLQYGLYGLYPKCRNYIDVYVVLLGMTGHGLILSTLNTHQGLLGDKLSQKIWPYLVNIFAPWIVPYSMQNLKENMASWIRQLADDRSILLPWIPSDGPLAQKVINVFFECVQFLIHTLPACGNILSFIWQWYVSCFAHNSVKDHVLGPIHHSFLAFPWEKFWPSLTDLECMLKIIDQYLPECHSFLGHIFMSIPWSPWIHNFASSPPQVKSRVHQCFLNLLVKLSVEPNVRSKHQDRVKSLLVEAENFDWSMLDPGVFQHVMDWYVLSCDCNVIFKHDPLDVDFRVLHFLKTVAGYDKPLERRTTESLNKRLTYVKTCVKLMSVCVNKHKSIVATKENEIIAVISQQLRHLDLVVTTHDEFNYLIRELLGYINLNSIRNIGVKSFEGWIQNKLGNSVTIKELLQVLGTTVNDNQAVANLLEATIHSYFQNNVSDEFAPTWKEIAENLKITITKQTELEQTMINDGNLLSLNALLIQRINKTGDTEALLNLAIEWISNIKICEKLEPKIILLWFGILKLSLLQCETDEAAAGAILYKFSKELLQMSEDKGGSKWGMGLLSAIGIGKQDSASFNFRFLCRALAGYILAQLPEMKGQPQVVRHTSNAPLKVGQPGGNSECTKVLMSLSFTQAQGKIKECEELALKQIQDAENSMHNVAEFLMLLVKQFYSKTYLKDVF